MEEEGSFQGIGEWPVSGLPSPEVGIWNPVCFPFERRPAVWYDRWERFPSLRLSLGCVKSAPVARWDSYKLRLTFSSIPVLGRMGSLAGNVPSPFEILPLFFQHSGHNKEEIRQWTTAEGKRFT